MTTQPPPDLEGWEKWPADEPFEDMAGPFFYKRMDQGVVSAFKVEPKHLNGGGAIHGGMLMTFADYALFTIGMDALGEASGVTVALNGDFTAAGPAEGLVFAAGEVVRETGSMVFVRGMLKSGDPLSGPTLLSFSGIVKKLRKRS